MSFRENSQMKKNYLKVSVLAIAIGFATQSNAALYRIIEVKAPDASQTMGYPRANGSAIESSSADLSCFNTECEDNAYRLAGDIQKAPEGFSYRQEVPFGIDSIFIYDTKSDLKTYCKNHLKYSTCNVWADRAWDGLNGHGGLKREIYAWRNGQPYSSNSSGFLQDDFVGAADSLNSSVDPNGGISTPEDGSKNIVVNALDGNKPIGNISSGYYNIGATTNARMYRNRGFYDDILLLPKQVTDTLSGEQRIVEQMGRTMAFDSFEYEGNKYVIGAGSVAPYDYNDNRKNTLGSVKNCPDQVNPASTEACQTFAFAMKAFVWNVTDSSNKKATGVPVAEWAGIGRADANDTKDTASRKKRSAQSSARAATIASSGTYKDKPILVGFNTERDGDKLHMQASVFYPQSDPFIVGQHSWQAKVIEKTKVKKGSSTIYTNSVATDINKNLLVIGQSKRTKPERRSVGNKLFIADANEAVPEANYFNNGIFFPGYNGKAGAINNFNEIVGQVDFERSNEVGGKKRRRRAFIYPYPGRGSDNNRMALFKNRAWLLDDLTNGGSVSNKNNHYRIIDASDINDSGVIAATALKCESQYKSISTNASCSSQEKIVAVKLVPINGAKSTDIAPRKTDANKVKRKGASLNIFYLCLLGFVGFIRKKHS